MALRIWIVTVGEPLPTDGSHPRLLRSGVLARELTRRGHKVTWWTSSFDHYGKRQRTTSDRTIDHDGIEIRMLVGVGYKRNVSLSRFLEHALVARKFRSYAKTTVDLPDVILASLPTIELAYAATEFGAEREIPTLVDVRDLWPDVIFQVAPSSLRWLARIGLHWLTRQARAALRNSAGIVAISPGYLEWGLRFAGRPRGSQDIIIPLGYEEVVVSEADFHAAFRRLNSLGVASSKRLCWYVGSFGKQYDLSPVIEAARILQTEMPEAQFVISGEGELGQQWRSQAQGLTNVVFTGWINGAEIGWLRANAAVGFQPYAKTAPQGLANKLFEYISAGIPVLSSLRGENEEFIERAKCGFTYDPENVPGLAARLTELLRDEDRRQQLGDNGRQAFKLYFSSDATVKRMADHLENMALSRTSQVTSG